MLTKYSKSNTDISLENELIISEGSERYQKQTLLVQELMKFPKRAICLCCGGKLKGVLFQHHGVEYIECSNCEHIQSAKNPPGNYPHNFEQGLPFSMVYPKLPLDEYLNRRNRIYVPKLDWIISTLNKLEYTSHDIQNNVWVEIGSGAGYFLSAAKESGIEQITGYEVDKELVNISKLYNNESLTSLSVGSFSEILDQTNADIYCSFFVLEHIPNLKQVWDSLYKKKVGTIFIFSVPMFGYSCLLEQAFPDEYARNLDGVVHTQMFTESSIKFGLTSAGYDLIGEWVFGQDISDLSRVLKVRAMENLGKTKIFETLINGVNSSHDAMQAALDVNSLSDQRHYIAIRSK
jgi:hypothetical protein